MSKRCERALEALKSKEMPAVLEMVMTAFLVDEVETERKCHPMLDLSDRTPKARSVLKALRDSYANALLVMMYVGRDWWYGESDHTPIAEEDIDEQFTLMWNLLGLDMRNKCLAPEILCSKINPDAYLSNGARMFRIRLFTSADKR